MKHELARRFLGLGRPRVAVIGDLILDRYVFGAVERISPEAPIQVLRVEREELRVGGAGNVAANLRGLGAEVAAIAVVGRDAAGSLLRVELESILAEQGRHVLEDPGRPTIEKTRMVASAQQVLRVDREDARPLDEAIERQVLPAIDRAVAWADLVIVSDYGKGLLTEAVLRRVIEGGRAARKRVIVDPKGRDFRKYRGASIVTPNRVEAEQITGLTLAGAGALGEAGRRLVSELDLEAAVITLGAGGIYVHPRDGDPLRVEAVARDVYDVTGAGDTVAALLGLGLAAGAPLEDAVRIANVGAGIVVGKLGTATVTRAEIEVRLLKGTPFFTSKQISSEDLVDRIAEIRAEGKSIVFTNGCFDVLHAGHVHFLEFARAQGDCLIVGLNGDRSVRELKGEGRPVFALRERMLLLGALEMVDYLVPFDGTTPLELIETIRPDVLVKGEDWKTKGVVGREVVEAHGGRVVLAPLVPGLSTTSVVQRIRGSDEPAEEVPPGAPELAPGRRRS